MTSARSGVRPLVSCILPTRGRPAFVTEAVRGFLEQDYGERELLVVEDGTDAVDRVSPLDPRIRYFRLSGRWSIGAKRNFGCAEARGEIVAHVDDDDWYPPYRLKTQVDALLETRAAICGTSTLYFFDPIDDRAWIYTHEARGWLAGSSLVYRRAHWQRHPFRPVQVGEDWTFVRTATAPMRVDLADPRLCVATLHRNNTTSKTIDRCWREVESAAIEALLGPRASAYRGAARAASSAD